MTNFEKGLAIAAITSAIIAVAVAIVEVLT